MLLLSARADPEIRWLAAAPSLLALPTSVIRQTRRGQTSRFAITPLVLAERVMRSLCGSLLAASAAQSIGG